MIFNETMKKREKKKALNTSLGSTGFIQKLKKLSSQIIYLMNSLIFSYTIILLLAITKCTISTHRPIIGVLTQPWSKDLASSIIIPPIYNNHNLNSNKINSSNNRNKVFDSISQYKSYMNADYVKYIEGSGGRVVPIPYNTSNEELVHLFNSINGLIFPGGNDILNHTLYYNTSRYLFQLAIEANNNRLLKDTSCTLTDGKGVIYAIYGNPGSVLVPKGAGVITPNCTKKGYVQKTFGAGESFNAVTMVNILFWPGFIVDAMSGSMHKYPSHITVVMEKAN